MLRSIFGSNWKNSPAHLLLLSKFRRPHQVEDFPDEQWLTVLHEKPEAAIKRIIKDGAIIEGDIAICLDYKFKVSDLKQMLIKLGLKQSGRKEELILRLLEHDQNGMKKAIAGLKIYICSDTGNQLAEDYLEKEKQKRISLENEVQDLLRKRNFRQASKTVADYEAEQVFARGMGIDWKNYDTKKDETILSLIFEKNPKILDQLDTSKREPLRILSGMMYLWGTNVGKDWIDKQFETGIQLDADTAARMYWFHAVNIQDLKEYKEAGFTKKVFILSSVNDNLICEDCKKLNGEKFDLNKVPELPYEKCTSIMGCRCTYIIDIKDMRVK